MEALLLFEAALNLITEKSSVMEYTLKGISVLLFLLRRKENGENFAIVNRNS
jgi:hypothetical protein